MLETLRHHYGVVKGFILPAMLIVGSVMLVAIFIARNSESCRKEKARGKKCPSLWRDNDEKNIKPLAPPPSAAPIAVIVPKQNKS